MATPQQVGQLACHLVQHVRHAALTQTSTCLTDQPDKLTGINITNRPYPIIGSRLSFTRHIGHLLLDILNHSYSCLMRNYFCNDLKYNQFRMKSQDQTVR